LREGVTIFDAIRSSLSNEDPTPDTAGHTPDSSSTLPCLLALFLFAVYLLTYSGRFHSSDGLAMYAMADSLARHGAADIDALRWMGLQQGTYGLDGLLYSRKGVGVSLLGLPLAWLGLVTPFWGVAQTFLLFNTLVTAATGTLLALYIKRCGYSIGTGLGGGLLYGLITMAWPYARTDFSDPLSGLLLLAAAYALLCWRQTGRLGAVVWGGVVLGLAVATRYANAVALPLFVALLVAYGLSPNRGQAPGGSAEDIPYGVRHRFFSLWPALLALATPLAAIAGALAAYNVARYGDPLQTGYLPQESFSAIWWEGILGLLISPGRGLFLYNPVLLGVFIAIPAALRQAREEALLAVSIFVAHVLLYGKWFMWHGGYAWGPRFLLPTLPFLVALMAPLLLRLGRRRPLLTLGFSILTLLSGTIQLLGVAIDFRLYQEALLDTGLPLYDPITFFDPRYSPLIGHLAYLHLRNLDFAWIEHLESAPYFGVDGVALALCCGLAAITGLALTMSLCWRRPANLPSRFYASWPRNVAAIHRSPPFLAVLALLISGVVLARYHAAQPEAYLSLTAWLAAREQPGDVILLNIPEDTPVFMDLYKGHLPMKGIDQGGPPLSPDVLALLTGLGASGCRLWFVPNWLPPAESGPELWLMTHGYQAESHYFGHQRLALYGLPAQEPVSYPAYTVFGDKIALRGYAFPLEATPGDVLPLILRWQALAPIDHDYHVFVHLLDSQGTRVAQRDGQPVLWTRPTSSWAVGEKVEDRYGLLLPADLNPGRFVIRVGLYMPASRGGQRLITGDGKDGVELGAVTVRVKR
jgi:hypothetical protein